MGQGSLKKLLAYPCTNWGFRTTPLHSIILWNKSFIIFIFISQINLTLITSYALDLRWRFIGNKRSFDFYEEKSMLFMIFIKLTFQLGVILSFINWTNTFLINSDFLSRTTSPNLRYICHFQDFSNTCWKDYWNVYNSVKFWLSQRNTCWNFLEKQR